MLKKLRGKFVLVNMAIVVGMLIVIFSLVYQITSMNLENESTNMLHAAAQSATRPGTHTRPEGVQLPYFTLRVSNWGVVTAAGVSHFDLGDEAFMQALLEQVLASEQTVGMIHAYHLRYYRTTHMGDTVIAFLDVSSHRAVLKDLLQICFGIGFVSVLLFFGISLLLANWAVKPVEKAWSQQKQFVSDASHELKTPLTVIMSNAELLQGQDLEPQSRGRYVDSILTMAGQMRKLVEGLLELARADNGQVKKCFNQIDYSSLASEALLPFEPVFYERGMHLTSRIEEGIRIKGSEQHLRQVIEILLDNACKYASMGIVAVQLQRQGRSCLLTVDSPGNPIPAEDLDRIFERFYRTDRARTGDGSFGLGLSIAKSIVSEHGGRIWAQSNQTGNRFSVQLPLGG